jgi:uncharacterized protein YegP (UPF0339 family)
VRSIGVSIKTSPPLGDQGSERKGKFPHQRLRSVLKAANSQAIGDGEMYCSSAAMEKGVASVKSNAPDVKLEDLTT